MPLSTGRAGRIDREPPSLSPHSTRFNGDKTLSCPRVVELGTPPANHHCDRINTSHNCTAAPLRASTVARALNMAHLNIGPFILLRRPIVAPLKETPPSYLGSLSRLFSRCHPRRRFLRLSYTNRFYRHELSLN